MFLSIFFFSDAAERKFQYSSAPHMFQVLVSNLGEEFITLYYLHSLQQTEQASEWKTLQLFEATSVMKKKFYNVNNRRALG